MNKAQHTAQSAAEESARFVFKDDHFGPRVSDTKTGRWMSIDLVREMFEAIPKRRRVAIAKATGATP